MDKPPAPRRYNDAESFCHIPPRDRECVRIGIASIIRNDGKRVKYNWAAVRELWLVDPALTLAEFAIKYQIPTVALSKCGHLSAAHKKQMLGIVKNGFFVQMMRKQIVRNVVQSEVASERLVQVLENISVFSESAAIFARARMAKIDPQGNEIVNIDAKSHDVKHYSSIVKDISDTLKNITGIRADLGLDRSSDRNPIDEIMIEAPRPKSRRIAGTTSTVDASTGTSTNDQASTKVDPGQTDIVNPGPAV